ncbi:dimethyl sulfoxide reductase anchor subunit [Luteolibacter yonseiensis]|uniref:Dimethyl sulfoxide reductase anchor subunit n=1 Tax=Luteolibacter yonseiensis TaxID=1144680 RepID=A0A934VD60_9BACT|nr:DmsC/YnfH family molybdoenzyme membrane anchor subunit [Luteolibacter yonseiensis]MBK1817224.1 dimethyl sulfoxide reductase anchor subunit [Luteolibacter yonseiensis]
MPATLTRLPAVKRAAKPDIEQGNLIDRLLAEQKQLQTPVARFSEIHHKRKPDLADHYRSLIPLTKPGEGEQYAFEVSLDRCTGCKACVSACHSLNGLDDDEAWRDVGTLLGGRDTPGWQQTVTTACHHCADPGCMNGCPVGAYEKEKDTGIVRHLDDQCIGCSYCILKCPYDVPKYSKKRGIVRKCDMCHQRLAEGEAPACVQACPTEAIRIIKVPRDKSPEARKKATFGDLFQATAHSPQSAIPVSSITLPTTRYVGREVPLSATAADVEALVPQHAHWPLVFMLMLTQAGAGLLMSSQGDLPITLTGTAIFFAGMGASVFHLGQPLKAWRFFLGLRTSWLSREILMFSMFAPIPMALVAFSLLPHFPKLRLPSLVSDLLPLAEKITTLSTIGVGLLAVFTSVMIYHDTRRSLWRFPLGAARFFGTVASFAALGHSIIAPSLLATGLFISAVLLKMVPELRMLKLAEDEDARWSPDVHSARLQTGPLGPILRARFTLAILAVFVAGIHPWYALPILLIAELLERQLYFQSVQAPKMPGNFGPKTGH